MLIDLEPDLETVPSQDTVTCTCPVCCDSSREVACLCPGPAGEGVTAAKLQMHQSVPRSGRNDAILYALFTLNVAAFPSCDFFVFPCDSELPSALCPVAAVS